MAYGCRPMTPGAYIRNEVLALLGIAMLVVAGWLFVVAFTPGQ